jgi:uncharacterized protein YtpQ (UPF0354 family)
MATAGRPFARHLNVFAHKQQSGRDHQMFDRRLRELGQFVILATVVSGGCSKQDILTPSQFTKEFAAAMRSVSPPSKVRIVEDLQIEVTPPDGHKWTSFLQNAYDQYKQDPTAKQEVIQRYVTSSFESFSAQSRPIDRSRIVPVIRSRHLFEETSRALGGRQKIDLPVHDDFIADLLILYAEDNPKTMRYVGEAEFASLKVDRKKLRALACENLKRLLPKIERKGANGLYMLIAGGDYESSLLLVDSMWNAKKLDVPGDIVVGIPTRDVLLVTGTGNASGIARAGAIAKKTFEQGSYALTPKLFVYRNGRFEEFVPNAGHAGS